MITFVFANQKGGVGKTTLARNFFFFCVEMGLRVLGVDMESQQNFSDTLFAYRKKEISDLVRRKQKLREEMMRFADKLHGQGKTGEAAHACRQADEVGLQAVALENELGLQPGDERFLSASKLFEPGAPKLSPLPCGESAALICADRDLIDVAALQLDELKNPRTALRHLTAGFDICIIDTAPTVGRPLFAALAAADYIICPCTMDQDAVNGATNLLEDIERVRMMGWNPDLKERWLVANQVDRRRSFHVRMLEGMKEQLGSKLLGSVLSSRAATNTAKQYPVWQEQGGQSQRAAASEMKALCAEILEQSGVLKRKPHV